MKDTQSDKEINTLQSQHKTNKKISKLPLNYSIAFITLVLCIWYNMTSFNDKMVGLFLACTFGITELTWTGLTIQNGEGVYFSPFSPKKRHPHTTPHQWMVNLIFMPMVIPLFYQYVDLMGLRLIVFPLISWFIEVIEGYFLMHIFGYNPAWNYKGDYTLFHGNIKLTYYPPFFVIGLWMEVGRFMVTIFHEQMLLRI